MLLFEWIHSFECFPEMPRKLVLATCMAMAEPFLWEKFLLMKAGGSYNWKASESVGKTLQALSFGDFFKTCDREHIQTYIQTTSTLPTDAWMSRNNLTSSLKTPCKLFLLKSVVVLFWSVWIQVAWYRSRCRCWLYPFLPWCWWTRCPSLQFARILGFWSNASFECSNDASAVRGNVARFSWIFFQERLMFGKFYDLFLCFCSDLSVRICVVGR